MTTLSQESQDALNTAIGAVESAIVALGAAYQQFNDAYAAATHEAFQNYGVHRASNVGSSIGPDRFNEAIFACMLAHGLAPLLKRTAMRADHRPMPNLAADFAARLAGV